MLIGFCGATKRPEIAEEQFLPMIAQREELVGGDALAVVGAVADTDFVELD